MGLEQERARAVIPNILQRQRCSSFHTRSDARPRVRLVAIDDDRRPHLRPHRPPGLDSRRKARLGGSTALLIHGGGRVRARPRPRERGWGRERAGTRKGLRARQSRAGLARAQDRSRQEADYVGWVGRQPRGIGGGFREGEGVSDLATRAPSYEGDKEIGPSASAMEWPGARQSAE